MAVQLAVCGLHLRGQPLCHQLTDLSGIFLRACRSAPEYRLFAISDGTRAKPGMVAVGPPGSGGGAAVELEIWQLPVESLGHFLQLVPPPLAIGTVRLEGGESVKGFVCEGWVAGACSAGATGIEDITHMGGWLAYLQQQRFNGGGTPTS